MKPRAHKPRGSLIALFVLLLLAATCGMGYLVLSLDGTKQFNELRKINQIMFLDVALQLPYQDFLTHDAGNKPDYIAGTEDEHAMSDMIGTMLLIGEDGSLIENNSSYANSYHSDKVYIQWRDGVAFFLYNETSEMAEKYNVSVYDRAHLDGGAAARGGFGYPFEAVGKLEENLNNSNIKNAGDMYIFIDTTGLNKRYLVILQKNNAEIAGMAYGEQLTDYDHAWRMETKNLLSFGFPMFLALYWLGLAYWVYLDARRRMMRADAWTIAVFITNLAGFIAYELAARARARREAVKICPACGGRMLRAFPRCPWCGAPQEKRCSACGGEMKDGWTVCPHCDGTPKAAEPGLQTPVETPATVPVPLPAPARNEIPEPEPEREPVIPPIFMDGSPYR